MEKPFQNSTLLTRNKHRDPKTRIESPEINPSFNNQLIFNKVVKSTQWGEGSLFNKRS